MILGYGEAEAHSSCEPDEPYNKCWQVDLTQLDYWQDTLKDPHWRDVKESDHEIFDYEVTIDAIKLNGGIIPTAQGQGHYDSEEDYAQAVEAVLGVPLGARTHVHIRGTSTKMATGCGPARMSTGSFVNDALTDEGGRLFIDGEDRTEDYIRPYRQLWEHEMEGDCPNGLDVDSGSTDNETVEYSKGELSSFPPIEVLEDGVYQADLVTRSGWMENEDEEWGYYVGSRIENVRHYLFSHSCLVHWNFDTMRAEIQCFDKADKLYTENQYPDPALCICDGHTPICGGAVQAPPSYNTTAHENLVRVHVGNTHACFRNPDQELHNHCAEGWADFVTPDVNDYGQVEGYDTSPGFCEWGD